MMLFKFLVFLEHPVTGVPTQISTLMAETGAQANRRAKALYTDAAWAVSEASHRVGGTGQDKLDGKYRHKYRDRWKWEDDED